MSGANEKTIPSVKGVCIGADDDFMYVIRSRHVLKYTICDFQLIESRKLTELPYRDSVLAGSRLYSRFLRRGPVTGAAGRTTLCFYTRRMLFLLDSHSLTVIKTVPVLGFHAPLNIAFDKFAQSEGYIFGEYSSNVDKRAVGIFRFSADGLEKIAEIPENEIEHIHNVLPLAQNKHLLLTGDFASSPSFWVYDSGNLNKLVGGKQEYRSCIALQLKDHLIYPTDTTTQENYLYRFDMVSHEIVQIAELPASTIYGDSSQDQLVFATNLEPSLESKFTIRKWVTRELPACFKTKMVHIYSYRSPASGAATTDDGLSEVLQLAPSRLPYRLFQYPTCRVWLRKNTMLLYGHSLRGYDGATFALPAAKPGVY